MNETPELESVEPAGTYRICTACQCRIHQSLERCPECGAYPGEIYPSRLPRKTGMVLKVLLVLFLGAALYLLSRNREEAREAELEEITVLSPSRVASTSPEPPPETPPADDTDPIEGSTGTDDVVNPFESPQPVPTPMVPETVATPEPRVIPTPTPRPLPTPTATPLPQPTPSPTPSVLDEKEKVKQELSRALDQQAPLAKPGDTVRLTLQNGQQIEGTLLQTAPRQFKLDSAIGSQWIPYRQLNLQSRLQVDARERDAFLEEKALEQILNRL